MRFFFHICYFRARPLFPRTLGKSHTVVFLLFLVWVNIWAEKSMVFTHTTLTLSLSLFEGVGDLCRTIRMADSLKITCFFTTSTLLPSEELWKTSCERSLENWNPFGPFLSIHKQRNDKLKEVLLHGAARSCMTS